MVKKVDKRNIKFVISLLIPSLLIIVIFIITPVLYNLVLSFTSKHPFIEGQTYAGLNNYKIITDSEFIVSFRNGIIYSFFSIFFQVLLGLLTALLLNAKLKFNYLIKAILIFPYLIPTIVVVLLWKWLFNTNYGVINNLLVYFNFNQISWFDNHHLMFSLISMSVWQFYPFVFVLILARLNTIPKNLYQMANIDGIPLFNQFVSITFPQIKSVLFSVILIRSIWMFTKFDTVWLIGGTGGGSLKIQNLAVLSYRKTFSFFQAGEGAAVSIIMLIIILFSTVLYYKNMKPTKQ